MAPKAGEPAAARVGDGADLGVVGSLHSAHARRASHDLHEGVIGIVGGVESRRSSGVGRRRRAGARSVGQEAAVHRHEMRREGHGLAELLLDLEACGGARRPCGG